MDKHSGASKPNAFIFYYLNNYNLLGLKSKADTKTNARPKLAVL